MLRRPIGAGESRDLHQLRNEDRSTGRALSPPKVHPQLWIASRRDFVPTEREFQRQLRSARDPGHALLLVIADSPWVPRPPAAIAGGLARESLVNAMIYQSALELAAGLRSKL